MVEFDHHKQPADLFMTAIALGDRFQHGTENLRPAPERNASRRDPEHVSKLVHVYAMPDSPVLEQRDSSCEKLGNRHISDSLGSALSSNDAVGCKMT